MNALRERFYKVFPVTSAVSTQSEWRNIQSAYSAKGRHYHNLEHLKKMFSELDRYPNPVSDPRGLSLAVFYHDLVYNPLRKDNEAISAQRAGEILSETSFIAANSADPVTPKAKVQRIERQILATKHHLVPEANTDPDLPILLDIDLAILGSSTEEYAEYASNVRREYRFYPDFLYFPARKKAMRAFLERKRIYHTEFFRDLYEAKARENIEREIGGKSV